MVISVSGSWSSLGFDKSSGLSLSSRLESEISSISRELLFVVVVLFLLFTKAGCLDLLKCPNLGFPLASTELELFPIDFGSSIFATGSKSTH